MSQYHLRAADLYHGVDAGEVFGPPVIALLVVLLLLPAGGMFLRPAGLHRDVGPVLHRDQRLLRLVPGRGGGVGGRHEGALGDEVVQVRHLPRLAAQPLGVPPVELLPGLLSDRLVEIFVDAGAGVVTNQGEPPERSKENFVCVNCFLSGEKGSR